MTEAAQARFAGFVATLGRGPGRSRALTRPEAAEAMALLLAGAPAPEQVGAFLMLLRYRGEDPDEIAGLVEGARAETRWPGLAADLDWPSYGAGRTRGAAWYVLAALALGRAGIRVFMHGTNAFGSGQDTAAALAALGIAPCATPAAARAALDERGFAHAPLATLSPRLDELLGLRRLLGLRSPLNTVARLLDPAGASAGVDGVFHPPYIETHLSAAERLGRARLLVLKGGGGEAERNPARPVTVHLWDAARGRSEHVLPPLLAAAEPEPEADPVAVWHGTARAPAAEARVRATIALGLLALGRGGDTEAEIVWQNRFRTA